MSGCNPLGVRLGLPTIQILKSLGPLVHISANGTLWPLLSSRNGFIVLVSLLFIVFGQLV